MFEIKLRGFEAKGDLEGFDPGSEQIYLDFVGKRVTLEVKGFLTPTLLKTMVTMGIHKLKNTRIDLTNPSKPSIQMLDEGTMEQQKSGDTTIYNKLITD
jgi:hypothetical protein